MAVGRTGGLALCAVMSVAHAYPNGTPHYVTDMVPACASCHAARYATSMPGIPDRLAKQELIEQKHYAQIERDLPPSPYLELSETRRMQLLEAVRKIDEGAKVVMEAPETVKPGGEFKVIVRAVGGNGPAIGIMLLDRPLRFQALPATAVGWTLTQPPEVRGQGGELQNEWLDRRLEGLPRTLTYVMVTGQRHDPGEGIQPEGEVTFTLRAPQKPGTYPLAAAFLYGTENTNAAGVFQRASGRILFTEQAEITVE